MNQKSLSTLALPLLLALPGAAQENQAAAMLKRPVDRALRHLFHRVGADKLAASRTPVLHAARYLVASVLCHRRYSEKDGPVIREFRNIIIRNRSADGGFYGKDSPDRRLATAWAVQALAGLDEQAYGATIKLGLGYLHKGKPEKVELPFDRLVEDYAEKLSGATAGEREARLQGWIGKLTAGQDADGSWPGDASAPHEKTLDRLVRLVALQQIALGRRQVKAADSLPAWFQRGIDFLLSRQEEGKWRLAGGPHPGITALGLSALLVKPAARRNEQEKQVIEQATAYLVSQQQENGSFSATGTPVYVTSVVVHALLATRREELKPAIRRAMAYLLRMQNVDGRGYTPGDRDYGSLGYGGDNRGDMSNLQLALDALRAAGLPKEDEALEKALVFITRSQNRASSNDFQGTRGTPEGDKPVVPGNDGGGIYYPGNTNAGYRKVGGTLVPRSYGSMTWALLKCYILCNVEESNPRVRDAWKWIQENYTLEENPGFSPELKKKNAHYQGLFYYYLTMARTLSLMGIDRISTVVKESPQEREARLRRNEAIARNPEDKRQPVQEVRRQKNPDGSVETWIYRSRAWRRELLSKLQELQRPDGSWVNDKASRWMEGNPDLATAYALLTAAHALDHPNVPGIR